MTILKPSVAIKNLSATDYVNFVICPQKFYFAYQNGYLSLPDEIVSSKLKLTAKKHDSFQPIDVLDWYELNQFAHTWLKAKNTTVTAFFRLNKNRSQSINDNNSITLTKLVELLNDQLSFFLTESIIVHRNFYINIDMLYVSGNHIQLYFLAPALATSKGFKKGKFQIYHEVFITGYVFRDWLKTHNLPHTLSVSIVGIRDGIILTEDLNVNEYFVEIVQCFSEGWKGEFLNKQIVNATLDSILDHNPYHDQIEQFLKLADNQPNKFETVSFGEHCKIKKWCPFKEICCKREYKIDFYESIFCLHGFRLIKMLHFAGNNLLSLKTFQPLLNKNNMIDAKELAHEFNLNINFDNVATNQIIGLSKTDLFVNLNYLRAFQLNIQRFLNPNINIVLFDFETINWLIPKIMNTAPYESIPIQYSMHFILNATVENNSQFKLNEKAVIKHYAYIANLQNKAEMIDDFAQHLIHDFNQHQFQISFAYHASYEIGCLRFLAEHVSDETLAAQLLQIADNVCDLKDVFAKGGFYHSDFRGSLSIKDVLPALSDQTYAQLKIQNGIQAQHALRQLFCFYHNPWKIPSLLIQVKTDQDYQTMTKDLHEYCALDTWSMFLIYDCVQKHFFKLIHLQQIVQIQAA